MTVELKDAYSLSKETGELFKEYTEMLVREDALFQEYLELQNYKEELEHLEDKYGRPYGRLYLAYCDGELAGCIGLKKIDEENGEMKRLYVRPKFRGNRIGSYLIQQIIEDAGRIGYSHLLLDTLPFLESAIHMYQKFGFYEIESYNDSPMETSIYMRLDLKRPQQFTYKKATIRDIEMLTRTRIEVLRAANKLSPDIDMGEVEQQTYEYYTKAICDGTHIAYLVFDDNTFVGAGGVSFFRVMPTYHNPSGKKAYIMNMYTQPEYRRKGIAYETLDRLVKESRKRGIIAISLEATDMGRPLYEKYGFIEMQHEMELPMELHD